MVLIDSYGTAAGWQLRFRIPDRDHMQELVSRCEARGLTFDVAAIYGGDEAAGPKPAVTAEQREAIDAALELGYFEIPRDAQLADVADHLGISTQATSERLRRGIKVLLETIPLRGH